jgi:hypothetical protein
VKNLDSRVASAERYRPDRIRLLLVAEAPPVEQSRYFYYGDVTQHDSLFRYVVKEEAEYDLLIRAADRIYWRSQENESQS